MNPFAAIFVLGNAILLFMTKRRLAPIPILLGASAMTLGQGLVIGPFNFGVLRILMFTGFARCASKSERPPGWPNGMDKMMIGWAIVSLLSAFLHEEPLAMLTYESGIVYNIFGCYFLFRTFFQDHEDVEEVIRWLALILIPAAAGMVLEHVLQKNLFSIFGGSDAVAYRDGKLRAQGPYGHSILAGTVGGTAIPLFIGIWRRHPLRAKLGIAVCLVMVKACSSSGPIMSVIFSLLGVGLWRLRKLTPAMRISAIIAYIIYDMVSDRPAYYIMSKIDLTGSSTGYHRAKLMEMAITHFNEWWLAGSDYTRHWMAYGLSTDPKHVDFTNQFLLNGVHGGFLLMVFFALVVRFGFRFVGRLVADGAPGSKQDLWLNWCLGSCLFTHVCTFFSVAYFDQCYVYPYMVLAMIGSLYSVQGTEYATDDSSDEHHDEGLDGGAAPDLELGGGAVEVRQAEA